MSTEIFAVGDVIVETEKGKEVRPGVYSEIIDIVMPEDTEDGEGFYCIENDMQSGHSIDFASAKRIMTAEEAVEKRRVPTIEEVRQFLQNAVLDEYENITIDTTDRESPDTLSIEGTTTGQRRFVATVRVLGVSETNY
ncbi:hypothetical protein PBI_CANTARE_123 [Brevibacterium phage Cantare]|uniref:Uncharacterized protein n=1 Tax=Brevibacterium phage Cantare TaxID=2338395 RepID=A0A3G3LZS0_9CAUD|nr:hypothetical protein PQD70_gp123 [Brevibacterium phage Cantare]AYQ99343.1 hypothetical protein PBI_CANTARE_123 [Brevibacterium phage Cantare]